MDNEGESFESGKEQRRDEEWEEGKCCELYDREILDRERGMGAGSAVLTYVATVVWPQGPALSGAPRFCRPHFQNGETAGQTATHSCHNQWTVQSHDVSSQQL